MSFSRAAMVEIKRSLVASFSAMLSLEACRARSQLSKVSVQHLFFPTSDELPDIGRELDRRGLEGGGLSGCDR